TATSPPTGPATPRPAGPGHARHPRSDRGETPLGPSPRRVRPHAVAGGAAVRRRRRRLRAARLPSLRPVDAAARRDRPALRRAAGALGLARGPGLAAVGHGTVRAPDR